MPIGGLGRATAGAPAAFLSGADLAGAGVPHPIARPAGPLGERIVDSWLGVAWFESTFGCPTTCRAGRDRSRRRCCSLMLGATVRLPGQERQRHLQQVR
jgi:hypothetical protein